jgi:hypothetical protein
LYIYLLRLLTHFSAVTCVSEFSFGLSECIKVRNACKILVVRKPRHRWEDNVEIVLGKQKQVVRVWNEFIWFRIGLVVGISEYGNESLDFLKVGDLLTRQVTINFSKLWFPILVVFG